MAVSQTTCWRGFRAAAVGTRAALAAGASVVRVRAAAAAGARADAADARRRGRPPVDRRARSVAAPQAGLTRAVLPGRRSCHRPGRCDGGRPARTAHRTGYHGCRAPRGRAAPRRGADTGRRRTRAPQTRAGSRGDTSDRDHGGDGGVRRRTGRVRHAVPQSDELRPPRRAVRAGGNGDRAGHAGHRTHRWRLGRRAPSRSSSPVRHRDGCSHTATATHPGAEQAQRSRQPVLPGSGRCR